MNGSEKLQSNAHRTSSRFVVADIVEILVDIFKDSTPEADSTQEVALDEKTSDIQINSDSARKIEIASADNVAEDLKNLGPLLNEKIQSDIKEIVIPGAAQDFADTYGAGHTDGSEHYVRCSSEIVSVEHDYLNGVVIVSFQTTITCLNCFMRITVQNSLAYKHMVA